MKNAVKVVASFFSSTIRSSCASYFLLTHQLLLIHTPATSCSHTSFILLARQLSLAHTPATSCSHTSFILLARQLHLAHAPATSCSHASYILLTHQLHHARTPVTSCSHASYILLTHQLYHAGVENYSGISSCKRRSCSVVGIGRVTKWKRAKRLRLLESAQTKGACHLRAQCYYGYLNYRRF